MAVEGRNYTGKLLSDSTPFAISEAFKMLRTNLFYTSKGEKCPVYAITSTYASSGKSLVISNVAISFAQLDKKVLLLDCDLRNPVLHHIFGVNKEGGMSELLAGADSTVDKYVKKTTYPNLSIITSGGTPPNPAELLASDRTGKLIDFLKAHYDMIFIDLPPALIVSDATVISDYVTGYIYAIRSNFDDSRNLKQSVAMMEQTGAKIVGFVLNDIDMKTGSRYGSKYKYYGKYKYGRYGRYGRYGYGKYGRYDK